MQVYFPHDSIREEQNKLLADSLSAIEQKKHLLAHAPSGLGKTSATMSPAISYALAENKTVFFLTPKISQHEIAVQLVNDINKKFGLDILGIDMVGKRYMCSHPFLRDADDNAFYELCKRLRKKEACEFYANTCGFTSEQRTRARLYLTQLKKEYKGAWHHINLKERCESFECSNGAGLCSYEAALQIAKKANVVIADYFHIFNPKIRQIVMQRLNKELCDSIVIVDEAHNLPERLRKLMSATLSTKIIANAEKEAQKLNAKLEELKTIKIALKEIAKKRISDGKNDALINRKEFELAMHNCDLLELSLKLNELASEYLEMFPYGRSAMLRISSFLEKWLMQDDSFIRIIRRESNGKKILLQLKALDSSIISRPIFDEVHASILMSGTLLPQKMYADLLGLEEERTMMREYKSPFPEENKLTLVVPSSTTKYCERSFNEYKKIAGIIIRCIDEIPGNVAVFFPSFEVLNAVNSFLSAEIKRPIFLQRERMNTKERFALLNEFRKNSEKGAVLLAVAAGSFAEGIDYIGRQLIGAIIVGIPLREMDLEQECLIEYYERKFGAGWHYAYINPAITHAVQAAGRVIRDRNDKGVIVFLDKRYLWRNFSKCFPKDIKRIISNEPEKYIAEFWKKHGAASS